MDTYPDKTALIYMGSRLTFKDVDMLSDKLANFLIQNGSKPNDVVGLHLPNIPAHYIGVVAVQKAGCVSTGLSPLLTPAEMAHQLNDSKTKIVLKSGKSGDDSEKNKILQYLKDKVAPYKVPKVIEFMDELPTSGVGKILKRELKKILIERLGK